MEEHHHGSATIFHKYIHYGGVVLPVQSWLNVTLRRSDCSGFTYQAIASPWMETIGPADRSLRTRIHIKRVTVLPGKTNEGPRRKVL